MLIPTFVTLVADPVFDGVNISIPQAVLEGGPWLIHKSSIILKKWSMDTRLLKEELTRIPIWVKLHDVIFKFLKRSISLIATLIEADLVDVVTIGIPSLSTTGNSSKKDNLSMSNSFSALNEEDEEDVENVYDESANLIQNTKAGGSSSFTAAAG
ncbi:zinc knuckle CX2CX4HX4C containing protein [Tanacetum coccineum]